VFGLGAGAGGAILAIGAGVGGGTWLAGQGLGAGIGGGTQAAGQGIAAAGKSLLVPALLVLSAIVAVSLAKRSAPARRKT
jgi:hypothetical protein